MSYKNTTNNKSTDILSIRWVQSLEVRNNRFWCTEYCLEPARAGILQAGIEKKIYWNLWCASWLMKNSKLYNKWWNLKMRSFCIYNFKATSLHNPAYSTLTGSLPSTLTMIIWAVFSWGKKLRYFELFPFASVGCKTKSRQRTQVILRTKSKLLWSVLSWDNTTLTTQWTSGIFSLSDNKSLEILVSWKVRTKTCFIMCICCDST